MIRLKSAVALLGMGLLVVAVLMDVTLGMSAWSRIVGWVAIAVLIGAVGIRLRERRQGQDEGDD